LSLRDATPDLDGAAPAKMLCNLRNRRRRAEECGAVAVQMADADSLDGMLDLLLHLHGVRWGARGETGVLAGMEAFHREVAGRFLALGWLRLFALQIGASTAAANYGFHVRDRAYSYIGGLDPDLHRLSPGGLVVQHAIVQAVRDGATTFDFLRGAEQYKYHWGARDVPQVRRQVWQ
jgi:CelD/BcsL family acetyltransferase involved in cellulose biosynthesis